MSRKSAGFERFSLLLLILPLTVGALAEPASAANSAFKQTYLNQRQNQISMINSLRPGWTTNQRTLAKMTTTANLAPAIPHLSRAGFRNNLPPTRMDSFVLNAGAHAEHIYGDENDVYECFTEAHRINTGIVGDRDSGLTTGHGSVMPDAWGRDEFLGKPEFSQSGRRGYEINEQAFRSRLHYKNSENYYDYDKADHQFYNGSKVLNKATQLDEDRARGENVYHPYEATQAADRQLAEQQVADAMTRYQNMEQGKGY